MAKYKIGITEAGDAGLDLSWEAVCGQPGRRGSGNEKHHAQLP